MPIINGKKDNALHVIHGMKDLVLQIGAGTYHHKVNGVKTTHEFKIMNILLNHNGPQDQEELGEDFDATPPIVVLAFKDDDAIDILISHLQTLKDSEIVFVDNTNPELL